MGLVGREILEASCLVFKEPILQTCSAKRRHCSFATYSRHAKFNYSGSSQKRPRIYYQKSF